MDPSVDNFHQILHPPPPTLAKSTGEVACVRFTMSLALCYQGEKKALLISLPGCNREASFLGEERKTRLHGGEKPTCSETDLLAFSRHNCMASDRMQAFLDARQNAGWSPDTEHGDPYRWDGMG